MSDMFDDAKEKADALLNETEGGRNFAMIPRVLLRLLDQPGFNFYVTALTMMSPYIAKDTPRLVTIPNKQTGR